MKNTDLLESAAVAWEAVLNIDPAPKCIDLLGTSAIRLAVVELAQALATAWNLSPESEIGACFDWDFAPRFFEECVEWTPDGPILKPDWRTIATGNATPRRSSFDLPAGNGYTHLEIETVHPDFGPIFEPYDPADPIVWSLYGRTPDAGVECIGDFTTFEAACDVARKLGGV